MENVTQAVQDELVKSLDYKLGSSNVNYIQSRRNVQYYPSSLSTFTPTTSRVARIPLTSGMDFIDPESIKIAFRVRNNDATLDLNPGTQEPSFIVPRPCLCHVHLVVHNFMFHVNMFEHSGTNVFKTASTLRQLYK